MENSTEKESLQRNWGNKKNPFGRTERLLNPQSKKTENSRKLIEAHVYYRFDFFLFKNSKAITIIYSIYCFSPKIEIKT